jgi:hypothetical protein
MRYVMFVCTDPSAERYDPKQDNIGSWVSEVDGRGIRISGNRLFTIDRPREPPGQAPLQHGVH